MKDDRFIRYLEMYYKEHKTINDISSKFGVPISEILKLNSNLDYNNLMPGEIIKIPTDINENFIYYRIKEGDSLYKISSENNIDVDILAEINGLDLYDYLYPNQIIMIPKEGVKLYITKEGDTLRSISNATKTSLNTLVNANNNIYLLPEQLIIYRE